MDLQEENRPSSNMSGLSLNGSGDQMEVEGTATSTAAPDRFRATNLYDRQIRLWGWEAQQRLMKSRLLMYGMNGVGAEVVKNLMLGGIRQMTIVDAAIVHQNDLSSNFFVRREDFGLNRASASAVRAQLLNPTCLLTAVEGDSTILTEDLVNEYDLVALNCVTLKEALRVGSICRKLGIPLFVSQVLGFHAFYVNDLNGLQFEVPSLVVEKTGTSKPLKSIVELNGASTSRVLPDDQQVTCTDNPKATTQESTELLISSPDLPTILTKESARRSGNASPMPKRMFGLKRIDPYLNMELILSFVTQKGRYPSHQHFEEDLKMLEHILTEIRPTGDTRVVEPSELLSPEANFTCAIFGGTLAQEIITVLTRRGYPIFNLYYLAAMDAMGSREYLQ